MTSPVRTSRALESVCRPHLTGLSSYMRLVLPVVAIFFAVSPALAQCSNNANATDAQLAACNHSSAKPTPSANKPSNPVADKDAAIWKAGQQAAQQVNAETNAAATSITNAINNSHTNTSGDSSTDDNSANDDSSFTPSSSSSSPVTYSPTPQPVYTPPSYSAPIVYTPNSQGASQAGGAAGTTDDSGVTTYSIPSATSAYSQAANQGGGSGSTTNGSGVTTYSIPSATSTYSTPVGKVSATTRAAAGRMAQAALPPVAPYVPKAQEEAGGPAVANTFKGISFACGAIPQANLLGVTMASNVQTTATNVSSEKVFFRYSVTVTGSRGTVRVFGSGQSLLGQGNFAPAAIDAHTYDSLFSNVGVQDEFPKTCQFSEIQVCPATPPAGFPKGNYYRPFLDGNCKQLGQTGVVTFPGSSHCAAVLLGDVGMASSEGFGAGWDATSVQDAIAAAKVKMDAQKITYNDPTKYSSQLFAGCNVDHGAIAGVRNPWGRPDVIVTETFAFGQGSSTESASANALTSCKTQPNSSVGNCEVLLAW